MLVSRFVGKRVGVVRLAPLGSASESVLFYSGTAERNNNEVSLWRHARGTSGELKEPELLMSHATPAAVSDLVVLEESVALYANVSGQVVRLKAQEGGFGKEPPTTVLNVKAPLNALAVSPNGDVFVAASAAGSLYVHDLKKGSPVSSPDGIAEPDRAGVNGAAFFEPGRFASVSSTGNLQIWDLRHTSAPSTTMRSLTGGAYVATLQCVSAHPAQPGVFAVGNSTGHVLVWDIRKPSQPVSITKAHEADIWDIRFHPSNCNNLFTCSEDGQALHWRRTGSGEFSLAGSTVQTTSLVGSPGLGINSIDGAAEIAVCGTDNAALAVITGLDTF
eukprot:m.240140 g.240140  ORF g.240140 m.240140 type:complete len:332 (+) comp13614_c0_seq1:114-1109(+)